MSTPREVRKIDHEVGVSTVEVLNFNTICPRNFKLKWCTVALLLRSIYVLIEFEKNTCPRYVDVFFMIVGEDP